MIVVSGTERREAPERVYGSVEPSPHVPVPTTKAETEQVTVAGIAHELSAGLGDCLCMIRDISTMLVGPVEEPRCGQPLPPAECLGAEIAACREVMLRMRSELQALANRLGV